jgi:hypothetical protein
MFNRSLYLVLVLCLVSIPIDASSSPSSCPYYQASSLSEDTQAPQITLLTPSNGSVVRPFTLINFSITDNESVSHVLYWWNVGMLENETLSAPYSLMTRTSETGHYLFIYANDTSDNWASSVYYFITDATEPTIVLSSPENGSANPSGTTVNASVTDLHLESVFYNWDGNTNQTWNEPYDTTLISGDGPHSLNVYASDSAGNWANAVFTLVTDDLYPVILSGPANESVVRSNQSIQVTVSDSSIDVVRYSWNTGGGITGNWSSFETPVPQGEGFHFLHVFANDTLGRSTNVSFVFEADNTPPTIEADAPLNNTVINSGAPIHINVTDLHLYDVLLSWDGVENSSGVFSTSVPEGDGTHLLVVYARDQANNWATVSLLYTVDDSPPVLPLPNDIVLEANVTGQYVTWTPTDANPSTYTIYLNGSVIESGSWTSGEEVSAEIDSSSIGLLNFTIVVRDLAGNEIRDEVLVRIVEQALESPWMVDLLLILTVTTAAISLTVVALLLRYRDRFKRP